MKTVSEIIDICDIANGSSVNLEWEEWQTLKSAVLAQLSHNTGSPKLPDYLDFHLFCDKEGLFPKQAENIYRYIVGQLRAGA